MNAPKLKPIPPEVEDAARAVVLRICPYFHVEQKRAFVGEKWPVVAEAIMADRRAQCTVAIPSPTAAPHPGSARISPTRQQKAVLDFLVAYRLEHGFAPSFQEIGAALGRKHKSGIHALLRGLEERGHIRRLPNRTRAIEVLA